MLRLPSSVFSSGCSSRLQCSDHAEGDAYSAPSAPRSCPSAVMDATNVCARAQRSAHHRRPDIGAKSQPRHESTLSRAAKCGRTRLVAVLEERVSFAGEHDACGEQLAQQSAPRRLATLPAGGSAFAARAAARVRGGKLALFRGRLLPSAAVLRRPLRLAFREPACCARAASARGASLATTAATAPTHHAGGSSWKSASMRCACAASTGCAGRREPPQRKEPCLRRHLLAAAAPLRHQRTSCGSAGTSLPATSVSPAPAASGLARLEPRAAAGAAAASPGGSPTKQRR